MKASACVFAPMLKIWLGAEPLGLSRDTGITPTFYTEYLPMVMQLLKTIYTTSQQ